MEELLLDVGYLKLILGPMFSGKTTKLIDIYEKYLICKKQPYIINYKEDTRYGESYELTSHQGKMVECVPMLTLSSLLDNENLIQSVDGFFINEGQFFPDLYEVVNILVNKYRKNVYIAALDGDYLKRPFPAVAMLLAECDDIVKLKSLCVSCSNGREALFSHRISEETDVIVIGVDNYIPLCRSCYNSK